jgi:hypothetical protein
MSLYESAPETKPIKIVAYPRRRGTAAPLAETAPKSKPQGDPSYDELIIDAAIETARTSQAPHSR